MVKKLLVTGHRGFIGRNVVEYFTYLGWSVFGFAGDIRSVKNVELNFRAVDPDYVIHLASYGNSPKHDDIERIYETNIIGMSNLLDVLSFYPKVKSIINAGTSSEYGPQDRPMYPGMEENPNTPYGISKLRATEMAKNDRRVITIRLFSVYGKYEDDDRFIPTLLRVARKEKLGLDLYPGEHDFIYVKDLMNMFHRSLIENIEPRIINAASTVATKNSEVVDVVRKVTGADIPVTEHGEFLRPYDSLNWSAMNSFYPTSYNLEEGIRDLWMSKN